MLEIPTLPFTHDSCREYPLVPELCLGTHSGGKRSLLFGGKETEFPGHLRAQTEFGHEE